MRPSVHHTSARRWSWIVFVSTLASIRCVVMASVATALPLPVEGEEDLLQRGLVTHQVDHLERGGGLHKRVDVPDDGAPDPVPLGRHLPDPGEPLEGRRRYGVRG